MGAGSAKKAKQVVDDAMENEALAYERGFEDGMNEINNELYCAIELLDKLNEFIENVLCSGVVDETDLEIQATELLIEYGEYSEQFQIPDSADEED